MEAVLRACQVRVPPKGQTASLTPSYNKLFIQRCSCVCADTGGASKDKKVPVVRTVSGRRGTELLKQFNQ
jgi:hypothetical protein